MLYKYPQREFPYAELVEENRRRGKDRARVRAARHRRLRRRPLLRRVRRVRQGRARRHPDAGHGAQPRPGGGDAAPAAAALVPQHLVLGRRRAAARPASPPTARRSASRAPAARRLPSLLSTASRRCCSPTTRRTPAALRRRRRRGLRQGRLPRRIVVDGRRDAVNPARSGTKAAAHYRARRSRPAARATVRLRLRREHARPRRSPTSTTIFEQRRAEADEFYAELQARHRRRRTRAASSGRRSPG